MMFSSNQILAISGSLTIPEELETALEFALTYSGNAKNMKQVEIDRGCKLLYQITEDGKYCIGWGFREIPDGWLEYPFGFDIVIVGRIIRQYLERFEVKKDIWDGSYEKGFIMRCIGETMTYKHDKIKKPAYGIVYFEPYTCFYSK